MRGGTSKCWIFRAEDLPSDVAQRDPLLARLFGSPEPRQIDGVGGGSSTTSKLMVVHGGDPAAGIIRYAFGQVSIDRALVEWDSNCGNCASGLALYAVQEGYAPLASPATRLRMENVVTGLRLDAEVHSSATQIPTDGDRIIPGTKFPGVAVDVVWSPPTWSTLGPTSPTGNAVDEVEVDGRHVRVSLLDAGAPVALLSAADFGLDLSRSTRAELDSHLPFLFAVRSAVQPLLGIEGDGVQSIPKVGFVGPSQNPDNAFEARMVSMTAMHPTIGVTSAVGLATAAGVTGSTVHEVAGQLLQTGERIAFSIGTLAGAVSVEAQISHRTEVSAVYTPRSARRLATASLPLA
jgi:2-methylaconitate cis-trans-isomerase PrpF